MDIDFKFIGGKKFLSLNTVALQIKHKATTVLYEIAKSMEKSFFSHVERVWPHVKKYLTYKFSTRIRHNMMDLVCVMMESCNNEDFISRL